MVLNAEVLGEMYGLPDLEQRIGFLKRVLKEDVRGRTYLQEKYVMFHHDDTKHRSIFPIASSAELKEGTDKLITALTSASTSYVKMNQLSERSEYATEIQIGDRYFLVASIKPETEEYNGTNVQVVFDFGEKRAPEWVCKRYLDNLFDGGGYRMYALGDALDPKSEDPALTLAQREAISYNLLTAMTLLGKNCARIGDIEVQANL